MSTKITLAVFILLLSGGTGPEPASAASAAVKAKQFPTAYFLQLHKAPLAEKKQTLARLDATLKQLNREGLGLIAKGAVLDKLNTLQPVYEQLTILDESGLLIMAQQVPNLYFGYQGPGPINPNIYIVIKQARVNFPESFIRYGFVVEGDFLAYADKFVTAILEGLEGASGKNPGRGDQEARPPAPSPPSSKKGEKN